MRCLRRQGGHGVLPSAPRPPARRPPEAPSKARTALPPGREAKPRRFGGSPAPCPAPPHRSSANMRATACSATDVGEYAGTRATRTPAAAAAARSTRSKPAQRSATKRTPSSASAQIAWGQGEAGAAPGAPGEGGRGGAGYRGGASVVLPAAWPGSCRPSLPRRRPGPRALPWAPHLGAAVVVHKERHRLAAARRQRRLAVQARLEKVQRQRGSPGRRQQGREGRRRAAAWAALCCSRCARRCGGRFRSPRGAAGI
jgi:hypothetical protein